MKKFFIILLALSMCICLLACSNNTKVKPIKNAQPDTKEQITTKKSTATTKPTTTQTPTTTEASTTTQAPTTAKPTVTQATTAPQPKHKDLNGRGHSDSGREEPDYRNVLGYVAVSGNEEYSLTHSEKFLETPWKVPIYNKVDEEYIESGFVDHKTEVVVKSQQLEHSGYGAYSGFLLVENSNNSEQFYINVMNFITNPYWTFSDLEKAVSTGLYIAEYNQVSDYPPVNSRNEKVDLDNGIRMIVVGKAGIGSGNRPDREKNPIKATVYKEWTYGYGDVDVYFNPKDLSIIY